jgi:hypothetical protein
VGISNCGALPVVMIRSDRLARKKAVTPHEAPSWA